MFYLGCTDVEESLLTPHLLSFKEEPHNISLGHSGWNVKY